MAPAQHSILKQMSKSLTKLLLFVIVIFIPFLDILSKYLTVKFLLPIEGDDIWYPYGGIGVFKNLFGIDFSVVYASNYGAAWSLFSNHQHLLLIARIVMILGLIVYAVAYNKNRSYDIPLALIITGASCNVLDYFIYGHVVDMFKFVFWGYHYPVFNVADSAICVGVFWFLIVSWASAQHSDKKG